MAKREETGRFYLALVIFSLAGQVAWVVKNMYFNVFVYKMFHASAADISRMAAHRPLFHMQKKEEAVCCKNG